MNQKQIGIIILIIGLVLALVVLFVKLQEDKLIESVIAEKDSCYLDDGTCLHEDRNYTLYILGWVLSSGLILLGLYLLIFDSTQKKLAEQQEKVSSALQEASKKDEFKAFLAGFNEEEQKILSAIKEQDGILQSTLRYRTGISKTNLSLLLKSLEERGIISRKEKGKSKEVYLRKKF